MKEYKNSGYGAVIKKYRGLAKMSQSDLGTRMEVSRNTVINWENESHQPDIYTIRDLCKELHIPIGEFFSLPEEHDLSEDENGLVNVYRDLSASGKVYAREAVFGIKRAEERAKSEEIKIIFFPISELQTAPAAGAGNPFNDLPPTLRFVRRTSANSKADAMVRVDGRSMEPFYHSGDLVYFKYTSEAHPGEVVICSTADGAVIKAVDENMHLYSLNEELPYGEKSEDDHVTVMGKVLGIVQPEDLPSSDEQALIEDVFADKISAFNREHDA